MTYSPEMIFILMASVREKSNAVIVDELQQRNIQGILPAHGAILARVLNSTTPLTLTLLATKAGRAKSTMTVMVNKLIKEGYLKKSVCSEDNRVHYIQATHKLLNLKEALNEISQMLIKKTYQSMLKKDRVALVALLEQVNTNLDF